jgi:hypothetical protein
MQITRKTGIILVINIVLMIALLIALLFLVQKNTVKTESIESLAEKALLEKNARDLYAEATAEEPYFMTHPEELAVKEIKIESVKFMNNDAAENTAKQYSAGDNIIISLSVSDYMDPKVAELQHVYGIKIWAETKDEAGNIVNSMSGIAVDTADYNPAKGIKLPFNILLTADSAVKPGKYKIKITALDIISKLQATEEDEFTII